jgi:hypothetical protein
MRSSFFPSLSGSYSQAPATNCPLSGSVLEFVEEEKKLGFVQHFLQRRKPFGKVSRVSFFGGLRSGSNVKNAKRLLNLDAADEQGCQILLGTAYQNVKMYTK